MGHVVLECAKKAAIEKLPAHDLRRTCAYAGIQEGELDQIQFLLGHVQVQTTERHLGVFKTRSMTGSASNPLARALNGDRATHQVQAAS